MRCTVVGNLEPVRQLAFRIGPRRRFERIGQVQARQELACTEPHSVSSSGPRHLNNGAPSCSNRLRKPRCAAETSRTGVPNRAASLASVTDCVMTPS